MPRVKINEPSIYVFSTRIQVRVSDLNYGNHLGNERVLAFAQEARLHFFAQYGMSELDFWGTSLIQGDAALTYANEGFLHDMIQVEIGVDVIS
ncbi:MAG: acyl-CoA thioester hydrolase, partial [bacterium]